MPNFKVGMVTHYFDKIGVAVIDLTDNLVVGDLIRIGDPGFEQTVTSMQIEHEKIDSADRGQSVGMKVDQPVSKGDEIFKLLKN